jgi:hypothetical protein
MTHQYIFSFRSHFLYFSTAKNIKQNLCIFLPFFLLCWRISWSQNFNKFFSILSNSLLCNFFSYSRPAHDILMMCIIETLTKSFFYIRQDTTRSLSLRVRDKRVKRRSLLKLYWSFNENKFFFVSSRKRIKRHGVFISVRFEFFLIFLCFILNIFRCLYFGWKLLSCR